jgi:hypothetical protein
MIRIVGVAFVIGVRGSTMSVGVEVAVPLPIAFRAVTSTRSRNPMSASRTP